MSDSIPKHAGETMSDQISNVSLVDGQAQVQTGSKTFIVSQRAAKDDTIFCPAELVVGALGS